MAENDTRRWHPSTLAAAGVILLVAGPIVALLVLRIFVFQLFNMPSGSMIPNVIVGDYFIAKQSSYDNTAPARGDIVVLNHAGVPYVKRVVGLPGDRIQMDRGNVVINGSPVRLKPAGSYSYTDESGQARHGKLFLETPPGGRTYLILSQTDDGPFDNTDIYTVPPDHYFVLGDNRDDSNDSRADLGYIERAAILGRPWKKYWNSQTHQFSWVGFR